MPVEILIRMDRVPTRDNKRVMKHLMDEIGTYRKMFSIYVELIPRSKKDVPEATIAIGERPVVRGYANIIPELKAAAARISSFSGSVDLVDAFFQSAISKKDTGEPGMHSGRDDNELTAAVMRATAEREKRRPQRGVSHNKNGMEIPEREPSASRRSEEAPREYNRKRAELPTMQRNDDDEDYNGGGAPHKGDIMSVRRIMESATDGGPSDNSDFARLASDPIDAKWWSNQFVSSD